MNGLQAFSSVLLMAASTCKRHGNTLKNFSQCDCLLSQCDSTNAHTLISEYYKKLLSLQAQAKDLMELQELLQSAVVNFSLLKQ